MWTWVSTLSLLLVGAVSLILLKGFSTALAPVALWTGWILFAALIFLTLYNVRKKFPTPYFFNSRNWLRLHIAVAIGALGLYVMHTGLRTPNGIVETTLATLWFTTMLSGFLGLFISRTFPRRLTTRGGEAVFERIPVHIRRLRESAETIVEESMTTTGYSTIAYFYSDHLRTFFRSPKNRTRHLLGMNPPADRLLRQIDDKTRFLNEEERRCLNQIADHVRAKDALDFHHAIQWTLKTWLFIHIALTYATVVVVFLHVTLVYMFGGVSL